MRNLGIALAVVVALPGALHAADDIPHRYLARSLDAGLVRVENPADGRVWSAWAYRAGSEYDIAISVRDALGSWSEPTFIGANDASSELTPTLAVDRRGTLYLAFAVRESGQVLLSVLPAAGARWSPPVPIALGAGRFASPALRVVGDRLVLACRAGREVRIVDLSLLQTDVRPTGVTDGPDGTTQHTPVPPEDNSIGR
jgi:hypothetical protein